MHRGAVKEGRATTALVARTVQDRCTTDSRDGRSRLSVLVRERARLLSRKDRPNAAKRYRLDLLEAKDRIFYNPLASAACSLVCRRVDPQHRRLLPGNTFSATILVSKAISG